MDAKVVLAATSAFVAKISISILIVWKNVLKEPTRVSITLAIDAIENAKLVIAKVGKS